MAVCYDTEKKMCLINVPFRTVYYSIHQIQVRYLIQVQAQGGLLLGVGDGGGELGTELLFLSRKIAKVLVEWICGHFHANYL